MQSDLLAAGDIDGLAGDCEMIDDDGADGDETVEEQSLSCPCSINIEPPSYPKNMLN